MEQRWPTLYLFLRHTQCIQIQCTTVYTFLCQSDIMYHERWRNVTECISNVIFFNFGTECVTMKVLIPLTEIPIPVLLACGFSCLTFWYEIDTVHSVLKCNIFKRLVLSQTWKTNIVAGICHYNIEISKYKISFTYALYMRLGILKYQPSCMELYAVYYASFQTHADILFKIP